MESLYHCAAYYPELWPESDIENDIFYMKKAGINLVRMGEFAWHFMEPAEDQINISFFVRIVNLLYKNGILGCSLAVGQQTLTLPVLVRFQPSQP